MFEILIYLKYNSQQNFEYVYFLYFINIDLKIKNLSSLEMILLKLSHFENWEIYGIINFMCC